MSNNSSKASNQRPGKLQTSKSFTRFESAGPNRSPKRSRASTLANEVHPELTSDPLGVSSLAIPAAADSLSVPASSNTSVFERPADDSDTDTPIDGQNPTTLASPLDGLPPDFDTLPIEIVSWADRFVSDLTEAKVFPQPPSIEALSEIFQEFYIKAEGRIGTHIKTLATLQSRTNSPGSSSVRRHRPSPRLGSRTSKDDLGRGTGTGADTGQPLLTAGEVHEKRRAKRLLEYKRILLEESVERRVTSALYEKLWRHRSSLDEVRDDKLRGKTGSLQLVGIGLKELGVDLYTGGSVKDGEQTTADRVVMVEEWISKAAEGLLKMNEATYPKGKLDELIAAYQKIVELLTKVHRGSSSADEILPTLIYTLIACPAEGLNVISNMSFIQNFRAANKMNGEAAYCLTNLEAAITFLETVDLATLRNENIDSGESKSEAVVIQPATPLTATFNPSKSTTADATAPAMATFSTATEQGAAVKGLTPNASTNSQPSVSSTPRSARHRRLSSLMSFPTNAFNTANETVRNTADQSIKSVSATLDNSFKLLFGRLREQQAVQNSDASPSLMSPVMVPRTLDDARRLVTPKLGFDDDGASETSSFQGAEDDHPLKIATGDKDLVNGDKVLGMIISKGRLSATKPRDQSTDSRKSESSSIASGQVPSSSVTNSAMPTSSAQAQGALDNAAEAFRSFGTSFNPLNRLSGAGFMRGFGRTSTPPSGDPGLALPPATQELKDAAEPLSDGKPEAGIDKLYPPPLQRFTDIKDIGELRVDELQGLLEEYHRIVEYLKQRKLV